MLNIGSDITLIARKSLLKVVFQHSIFFFLLKTEIWVHLQHWKSNKFNIPIQKHCILVSMIHTDLFSLFTAAIALTCM